MTMKRYREIPNGPEKEAAAEDLKKYWRAQIRSLLEKPLGTCFEKKLVHEGFQISFSSFDTEHGGFVFSGKISTDAVRSLVEKIHKHPSKEMLRQIPLLSEPFNKIWDMPMNIYSVSISPSEFTDDWNYAQVALGTGSSETLRILDTWLSLFCHSACSIIDSLSNLALYDPNVFSTMCSMAELSDCDEPFFEKVISYKISTGNE